MPASLHLNFHAVPDGVRDARTAITLFCEGLSATADATDRVSLAVTEACARCVAHDEESASSFTLDARALGSTLMVTVRNPDLVLRDVPHDPRELGLSLRAMGTAATSVDITSRPGMGTRVKLRFTLEG
jgi:anti-sigma regulatory factor (Ser/Thr protein kinase)